METGVILRQSQLLCPVLSHRPTGMYGFLIAWAVTKRQNHDIIINPWCLLTEVRTIGLLCSVSLYAHAFYTLTCRGT